MEPTVQPDGDLVAQVITKHRDDLHRFFLDATTALNINGISGDYVEFGSWGGASLTAAHHTVTQGGRVRRMWAFDSFEGLPVARDERDVHPQWGSGGQGNGFAGEQGSEEHLRGVEAFQRTLEAAGVPRDAYTAVPGYFEDVLPTLGDRGPTDIALAYVDCNMYSSSVTVLAFLEPLLKHGMIVAFDDYQCWSPERVSGQRAAVVELLDRCPQWRFRRFKDLHWGGVSFVVERTDAVADQPRLIGG